MKFKQNNERIEGRIYQHDLALKVTGETSKNPGTEYISGNLEVATDEAGLNVIPVHFTYVTATTGTGKNNATFGVLKKIIEEGKTWLANGPEEATKVRIDTSLGLNEFYSNDDQLVSVKQNEGGFVSIVSQLADEAERNTFSVDMVITGVTRVEKDEEKNIEADYVVLKGAIFNFRGQLLPVEFAVRNEAGMKYFEDMGVTNAEPTYTRVWGKINSTTITTTVEEESAFGEPAVRTRERKVKEWTVSGALKVPYEYGDPEVLDAAELTKLAQDREIALADIKKRADEYRAQRAANNTATPAATTKAKTTTTTTAKAGTFNF